VRTATVVMQAIINRGITPYGNPILLGANMTRVKAPLQRSNSLLSGLLCGSVACTSARHIPQGARNQPIKMAAIHRLDVFFISVFTRYSLCALPVLDLSNPKFK